MSSAPQGTVRALSPSRCHRRLLHVRSGLLARRVGAGASGRAGAGPRRRRTVVVGVSGSAAPLGHRRGEHVGHPAAAARLGRRRLGAPVRVSVRCFLELEAARVDRTHQIAPAVLGRRWQSHLGSAAGRRGRRRLSGARGQAPHLWERAEPGCRGHGTPPSGGGGGLRRVRTSGLSLPMARGGRRGAVLGRGGQDVWSCLERPVAALW